MKVELYFNDGQSPLVLDVEKVLICNDMLVPLAMAITLDDSSIFYMHSGEYGFNKYLTDHFPNKQTVDVNQVKLEDFNLFKHARDHRRQNFS